MSDTLDPDDGNVPQQKALEKIGDHFYKLNYTLGGHLYPKIP